MTISLILSVNNRDLNVDHLLWLLYTSSKSENWSSLYTTIITRSFCENRASTFCRISYIKLWQIKEETYIPNTRYYICLSCANVPVYFIFSLSHIYFSRHNFLFQIMLPRFTNPLPPSAPEYPVMYKGNLPTHSQHYNLILIMLNNIN